MALVIGVVYFFYHQAVIQEARAVAALEQARLQKDHAVTAQQQAQLQESRAVSTLARQATERGDAMTGMLATLAVLPKDSVKADRPVSNAASAALLDAWLRDREKNGLIGHTGPINGAAFSPDGGRVVTGSEDNTARVWDLSGATPAATVLEGHRGPVSSVAFSPDGRRVVTGSADNTVWDLSGVTRAATLLEGHLGAVTSVAFSSDGRRVVTGSDDKTARVWDLSGATPAATVLEGPSGRGHQRSVQPRRTARGDGVLGQHGVGVERATGRDIDRTGPISLDPLPHNCPTRRAGTARHPQRGQGPRAHRRAAMPLNRRWKADSARTTLILPRGRAREWEVFPLFPLPARCANSVDRRSRIRCSAASQTTL